jgi:dolichyl-phosphate-mannose--protein O-mannosyl transferase
MLYLKNINVMAFAVLVFCICLDLFYKSAKNCEITNESYYNIFFGLFYGFIVCFLMYGGGSSQYLFFSELSSREVCSIPQRQKFKCNVYRNGELVKP